MLALSLILKGVDPKLQLCLLGFPLSREVYGFRNNSTFMLLDPDVQILPLQVPQGIQEKAQSTQGQMDKGFQESSREGTDYGELGGGGCRNEY